MKKYSILFIGITFFVLFISFFVTPVIFNKNIFAATQIVTVQCTCDNPGKADQVDNNNQVTRVLNGYTCTDKKDPTYSYRSTCTHQEEKCIATPGNQISTQDFGTGNCSVGAARTGNCNPYQTQVNYVGVSCQTTSVCTCSPDKKSVQCYTPANGKKTQQQQFNCAVGKACQQQAGVNDSGFSYLNRPVTGIACVSQCKCDHPGPPTATNKSTGPGNNGYTCTNDPTHHYCTNQEDYCTNTPSGTQSISCINSSKCTCNTDKSAIVCESPGSGNNGGNESQTFECNGPGTCEAGKGVDDPNFKFANQHITGVKCGPPPTIPPPPSPPCLKWANGTCTSFDSAFGGSTAGGFSTDPSGFIQSIFAILLSVSGGIALLLIMKAGYQMMTAQGNPEKLNNAREQLVAAIVGLVFLIFSFVFLTLIGFNILQIPGFKP